jgi:hypothetical protein
VILGCMASSRIDRGFSGGALGLGFLLVRWRTRWRGGGRFLVGALAHASRVGAVVASGGVRLRPVRRPCRIWSNRSSHRRLAPSQAGQHKGRPQLSPQILS